jgi:hypothetical protein
MWGKDKEGGGGSFGGIGNLMENMKQAQQLVQGEAGRIQKELSACVLSLHVSCKMHVRHIVRNAGCLLRMF